MSRKEKSAISVNAGGKVLKKLMRSVLVFVRLSCSIVSLCESDASMKFRSN